MNFISRRPDVVSFVQGSPATVTDCVGAWIRAWCFLLSGRQHTCYPDVPRRASGPTAPGRFSSRVGGVVRDGPGRCWQCVQPLPAAVRTPPVSTTACSRWVDDVATAGTPPSTRNRTVRRNRPRSAGWPRLPPRSGPNQGCHRCWGLPRSRSGGCSGQVRPVRARKTSPQAGLLVPQQQCSAEPGR